MAYASWSVVFGEQPSAAKWNILGTNDASFNDGTGIADGAIGVDAKAQYIYATLLDLSAAGTGSEAVTGVGFKPKAFIVLGHGRTSATQATFASGYAYDTGAGTTQGSVGGESTSSAAVTTETTSYAITTRTTSAVQLEADVTSWDSDGVTLNIDTNTGDASYCAIHIVFFG